MVAAALTAVAIGASATGAYMQYGAAKGQTAAMQQQIQAEQKAEVLRKRQMELEARRRGLEIVRNQQRARASALTAATAQGARSGSGLQGGYGQIAGDSGNQLLNTSQNLEIGRGLFDANMGVSNARMSYASYGTEAVLGRGLSSFGSTLMSVTPQLTAGYRDLFGTTNTPSTGGLYRGAGTYGGASRLY